MSENLLARAEFDAADLWRRFPPAFSSRNKKRVLAIATASGGPTGPLTVSRFAARAFPSEIAPAAATLIVREGVFDYEPVAPGAVEWHVNFADPDLFFACGGPAFAQDEIQVAEHPVLASLRAALVAEPIAGLAPITVDKDGPTPILVEGAQRQCSIALAEIYGRLFDRAKEETIRAAVTPCVPAKRSNIVAMSAPAGGTGRYARAQIAAALQTASTAFAATKDASKGARIAVHTGHWGTGAFGGDRVLMAAVQLLAARLARVDVVAFHAVDAAGVGQVRKAEALVASRGFALAKDVDDLLDELDSQGFRWGVSDGN